MKNCRLLMISAMVLGFHLPVWAAEEETEPAPIDEMNELIAAGEFQEAFKLGDDGIREGKDWEGDPEFDFAFGLAALESGNANEAVFALERVAATSTDGRQRDLARLELARAYFTTNNLTAAENLFNVVLQSNPPTNVQQNIEVFLQLIEARRDQQSATFNWSISSVVGADDNINSATGNAFIDTPIIGQIELDPAGRETDDEFSNTTLTMNYNYPITRNRSIDVNVNLMHLDNFSTDQFDIDNVRGEVAYTWGDEENRFRHGLTVGQVNLDGSSFQDSVGINSSYQHVGSNGWYQSLSASLTQIRYDTSSAASNALRDVDQWLVTGGLTKIQGLYTHSLNLYHANEDPENPDGGSHNGRRFTGLAYNLLYRLNAQHTPFLRASFQDVEHDSEHPVFFDTVRSDENKSMTVGWFWQYNRRFMLTAEASYTDNSSDIELFDYSRSKYQVGFRYQF